MVRRVLSRRNIERVKPILFRSLRNGHIVVLVVILAFVAVKMGDNAQFRHSWPVGAVAAAAMFGTIAAGWLLLTGKPAAANTWVASEIWAFRGRDDESPLVLQNRERLLNHIQNVWIEGYLRQALPGRTIELAWDYQLQTGQTDPAGETLLEIWRAAGRNLLILGEPGSGKTITLLQLAEQLVATARQYPSYSLPLVLNLSSWSQKQGPLDEWMVEEAFILYGIPYGLSYAGFMDNQFVYLLDGLDEMSPAVHDACVEAIRDFRARYPGDIVLCDQPAGHEATQQVLQMGVALQLLPLTDAQIADYLGQEAALQALRESLSSHPKLRELAGTPLMLHLLAQSYRGASHEELELLANQLAPRPYLLDRYVQRLLANRPETTDQPDDPTELMGWLARLAHQMKQQGLSIFHIERLQPSWLPTPELRRSYRQRISLITGAWFAVMSGLLLWVPFSQGYGRYWGRRITRLEGDAAGIMVEAFLMPILTLVLVLLSGLAAGLLAERMHKHVRLAGRLKWRLPPRRVIRQIIKAGGWGALLLTIIGVPIVALVTALYVHVVGGPGGYYIAIEYRIDWFGALFLVCLGGLFLGPLIGLFLGMFVGLLTCFEESLAPGKMTGRLRTNQGVGHSGRAAVRILLLGGWWVGLFTPMLLLAILGVIGGEWGGLVGGIVLGIFLWICSHHLINLFRGLLSNFQARPVGVTAQLRTASPEPRPGAGLYVGLVVGAVLGTLSTGSPSDVLVVLRPTLSFGLTLGLVLGFFKYGGLAILQHYVLRGLLAQAGVLPYPLRDGRLSALLDAAQERKLWQRVGGGWTFMHHSLRDHVAGLRYTYRLHNKQ